MMTAGEPRTPIGLRASCRAVLVLVGTTLAGCGGPQSALAPMGSPARETATLWWVMLGAATAIFALVLMLMLIGLFRKRRDVDEALPGRMIVLGGIALPVVALSALLPFGAQIGVGLGSGTEGLTVRVVGHQWWWEVEYVFPEGAQGFATANELHIPLGEPVQFEVTSRDVIHSLWVPKLGGKIDLIPGRTNRFVARADTAGDFRGQCAEFCGLAHAMMAFYVVVLPPEEFEAWAEAQRKPAPADEVTAIGREVFRANGCHLCHTVRGHEAWGRAAPDLTHIGSRRTIGAGLLGNDPENISYWLAHNDAVKPGNKMPEYDHLDEATRFTIAAYLTALQ